LLIAVVGIIYHFPRWISDSRAVARTPVLVIEKYAQNKKGCGRIFRLKSTRLSHSPFPL
jgi:hypothetical protein